MPDRSAHRRAAARPRRRHRRSPGFTLSELLLVITIVSLITLVAYPSMRTFLGYNDDAGAATRLTRTYNRVIDQARRNNRAHIVEFSLFLAGEPGGRMAVSESRFEGCTDAAERREAGALTPVETLPFGGTVVDDYVGPVEAEAGLASWRLGDAVRNDILRLCVKPDGSSWRVVDDTVEPVSDGLSLRVQRFEKNENGWGRVGPGREVRLNFGEGAQMQLVVEER